MTSILKLEAVNWMKLQIQLVTKIQLSAFSIVPATKLGRMFFGF